MKNKILVLGSYNVGLTMSVDKLPALGETVLGSGYTEGPGGKGSNQAIAAKRLGGRVEFVGCIGTDPYGKLAEELWSAEGVEHGRVKKIGVHTGLAFILVDGGGNNVIAVDPGANSLITEADVEGLRGVIAEAGVLLLQLETPLGTAVKAASLARESGTKVILNPAPMTDLSKVDLSLFDMLTPNLTEFRAMMGEGDDLRARAARVLDRGAGALVVTMGEEGAFVATKEDSCAVPAPKVGAVDPTGAGDAFNGALAVALMEGEDLRQAVAFANYAGALTVTKREVVPALPTRAELEEFRRNDVLE
ncbi:MAG: ribokinase [Nitrososphaerota archaeon]|nr:ribokinase [Nitrososphaerota archaeon]MDG6990849.1 ribokinase [Nitrososphaerota archaeon]